MSVKPKFLNWLRQNEQKSRFVKDNRVNCICNADCEYFSGYFIFCFGLTFSIYFSHLCTIEDYIAPSSSSVAYNIASRKKKHTFDEEKFKLQNDKASRVGSRYRGKYGGRKIFPGFVGKAQYPEGGSKKKRLYHGPMHDNIQGPVFNESRSRSHDTVMLCFPRPFAFHLQPPRRVHVSTSTH